MSTLQSKKELKVLFVGLGSIGSRHLKNISETAKQNSINLTVHALRNSLQKQLSGEISVLVNHEFCMDNLADNLNNNVIYDIVFITNPTIKHYEIMCLLKNNTNCFFIEKPIFESTVYNLKNCINEGQKAYIAAPMRFCKTMLELNKLMPALKVYSARAICSSYLPSWRKNVDYRDIYSAKKELGGGVDIDLIHEWDYLTQLFGMPKKVFTLNGKYSHLEINSCDIAIYIAEFEKNLCELHLDYFGRDYKRVLELYCENGTVVADFGAGTLSLENGQVINCNEDVNCRYMREMEYFLEYYFSQKTQSQNSPKQAYNVLKLALGEF